MVACWLSALGVVGVWGAIPRASRSGRSGGGECSDRGERSSELVGPWPVGWEPEGECPGAVHNDSGEGDEPVADRACGPDRAVEGDDPGPSAEVVCEDRAREPGPVGSEAA